MMVLNQQFFQVKSGRFKLKYFNKFQRALTARTGNISKTRAGSKIPRAEPSRAENPPARAESELSSAWTHHYKLGTCQQQPACRSAG